MKFVQGDLWSFQKTHWIVVPVNCGYKKNGMAIMGAGVALQAARRHPSLRSVWGARCRTAHRTGVKFGPLLLADSATKCILFPSKPLDPNDPSLSWQLPSTIELVTDSAKDLARQQRFHGWTVALPLVGCGFGGLRREDVVPMLERVLDNSFVLVEQEGS